MVPPKLGEAAQLTLVLWFVVAAIITPGALFSGQVNGIGEFLAIWTGFVTAFILGLLLYFGLRIAAGNPVWLALPLLVTLQTLTAMLQTAADYGGQHVLHMIFEGHRLPDQTPQTILVTAAFYWALDACNIALLWIAAAARKIRLHQVELAEARAASLEAQLNMLRMQVNPHFMGNSLNVISSLIIGGRLDEAQRMADKLAAFLRAATAIEGLETELGEELDMINAYLDVEAGRFGERLDVNVERDAALEPALVPTFILQPLVENALKYGVQRTAGPASLRIRTWRNGEKLALSVENEAESISPSVPPAGTGIGLANVRSRLDLLFGDAARFDGEPLEKGYRATILIPCRIGSPMGGDMRDA